MNRLLGLCLCLLPLGLFAQKRTVVGVNFSPLLINTLDLRVEQQMNSIFSFQFAAGFRSQTVGENNSPRIDLLRDYIHVEDRGLFLSVGGRIFNSSPETYEYPYIALDLTGVYFKDVFSNHPDFTEPLKTFADWKLGGSMTLGFVITISNRLYADLALQLGYSPMRPYAESYYLGGLGYTTFGPNRFSFEGAHFQPIITLKYVLLRDKRERIRDKE